MTDEAKDLARLIPLARAMYLNEQSRFQKILAEEARLRADLQRLADLARSSQPATRAQMRAIGGDIHWQAWMGRTQERLNLELARVLARKGHEQTRIKRAFGRLTALQELSAEARTAARRKQAGRELDRAVEAALHHQRPQAQ